MRDIELNSPILRLVDFPKETTKIMIMYDNRGWAIRCYNDIGGDNKITTMVPAKDGVYSSTEIALVPREQA